jgi:hypothetical protein
MNEPVDFTQLNNEPLTTWANPPSLMKLKQDLQDARPIHETQKDKIAVWIDNLNGTGKAKVNAGDGNSKIVPKLIRKQAEWRYAALSEPFLGTADLFKVKPNTWEDVRAARQNELVLNNQFTVGINKVAFIDEYVRTAVDEGTVIVQTGWEFYEETYKKIVPMVRYEVDYEFGPMHEYLEQLRNESPSQYATDVPDELKQAHDMAMDQNLPVKPVIFGEEEKTLTRTVCNKPTVTILDYRNVVIDPTCNGDIKKAKFIVHSFETCLADLQKDGRYKNLKQINVTGSSILGQPDHAASDGANANFNFNDQPRKKFIVYEYWGFWDIEGDGVLQPIVEAWAGDSVIRQELNPFKDKELPFVVVQYLPVRRSVYGEPDGALLEDNQKVVGAVTRGMIDIMGKSANGQTGIRKDMLDTTNRRKFDKGLDYEFNPNVDPNQGVHMHKYPEIPQSAQFMIEFQNAEAESMTGVKSWSGGISGSSLGDVAAGVRGALDAASKRELGILRRLSAGITQIGRKFIAMNSQFLAEEEVVRLTNDEFVAVRREDLAGNFDLQLSISTAEEDAAKAQELSFMLQTMGNNMDPAMSRMILADIARLRKMTELAHSIENYEPQPDPVAQMMQKLELAKLEAEVAEIQAKTQKILSEAGLNGAKIGTEGAKASHLQADSDQKNLDFVEQESGVTQERDLQQIGEQARSQARLKVVDHGFKMEEKKLDLVKQYIAQKANKKS